MHLCFATDRLGAGEWLALGGFCLEDFMFLDLLVLVGWFKGFCVEGNQFLNFKLSAGRGAGSDWGIHEFTVNLPISIMLPNLNRTPPARSSWRFCAGPNNCKGSVLPAGKHWGSGEVPSRPVRPATSPLGGVDSDWGSGEVPSRPVRPATSPLGRVELANTWLEAS